MSINLRTELWNGFEDINREMEPPAIMEPLSRYNFNIYFIVILIIATAYLFSVSLKNHYHKN